MTTAKIVIVLMTAIFIIAAVLYVLAKKFFSFKKQERDFSKYYYLAVLPVFTVHILIILMPLLDIFSKDNDWTYLVGWLLMVLPLFSILLFVILIPVVIAHILYRRNKPENKIKIEKRDKINLFFLITYVVSGLMVVFLTPDFFPVIKIPKILVVLFSSLHFISIFAGSIIYIFNSAFKFDDALATEKDRKRFYWACYFLAGLIILLGFISIFFVNFGYGIVIMVIGAVWIVAVELAK